MKIPSVNLRLATLAILFFGRLGALYIIPAGLVSYSRIYCGSHWPSDVITSIFLGLGATAVLLVALDALWRRCGTRCLPAVHARHPGLFTA